MPALLQAQAGRAVEERVHHHHRIHRGQRLRRGHSPSCSATPPMSPCASAAGAALFTQLVPTPEQTRQRSFPSPGRAFPSPRLWRPRRPHLDGAGDVQTLLHARDLQLQHPQVLAAQSDGARGAREPAGGGDGGVRGTHGDKQTHPAAPLPPGLCRTSGSPQPRSGHGGWVAEPKKCQTWCPAGSRQSGGAGTNPNCAP